MSNVISQAVRIKKILTHEGIHFDEALALFILTNFPSEKYPGAAGAKVEFLSNGGMLDKTAEEYRKEGILLVGIGGGELDEHATANREGLANECAATLVAKAVGVENDPALKTLLEYAERIDRSPTCQPFEFPTFMKEFSAVTNDSAKLWKLTRPFIEAKWYMQNEFHQCHKDVTDECFAEFGARGGKQLLMVAVKTDNPQMNKYLRAKYPNCAVVVQQNSKGNIQILTNNKYHQFLNLEQMVKVIRSGEMFHRGIPIPQDKDLSCDGRVIGADCWWYQKEAGNLFNGSLTARDVQPTQIPWKELCNVVYDNI